MENGKWKHGIGKILKKFVIFEFFSVIFFSARSFNEVGKTGKEERKSKNEIDFSSVGTPAAAAETQT